MANTNESDSEDVVMGVVDVTFSTSSSDNENGVLHNISDSDYENGDSDYYEVSDSDHRPYPAQQSRQGQWVDVSNNDPGPSHEIPVCNPNHPVLPELFDEHTEPI